MAGKPKGQLETAARVALNGNLATVGADDALGDHEAETTASLFCGEVGLEDPSHRLLAHAPSRIGEGDVDPLGLRSRPDLEQAALLHRLAGVFHDVEESLLELILIDLENG